ncbi:Asp23/Gls24 family envelope stress response protein [Streptomyces polygonati]|uniref:Asp23/Gls24 family envelope stress response protein n=1 Tax=Streptomyces polygonati TaxID=1617087 RepID=A0ABV8HEJ8_9ACTN
MAAPVPQQLPPAERGSLRIADRVVAKIASYAAGEVLAEAPGAELVPRDAVPHATVSIRRDTARLRLTLELGYPADLGAVSASVRRHVGSRVEALTGLAVPELAVEIERLHSASVRRANDGRVR